MTCSHHSRTNSKHRRWKCAASFRRARLLSLRSPTESLPLVPRGAGCTCLPACLCLRNRQGLPSAFVRAGRAPLVSLVTMVRAKSAATSDAPARRAKTTGRGASPATSVASEPTCIPAKKRARSGTTASASSSCSCGICGESAQGEVVRGVLGFSSNMGAMAGITRLWCLGAICGARACSPSLCRARARSLWYSTSPPTSPALLCTCALKMIWSTP